MTRLIDDIAAAAVVGCLPDAAGAMRLADVDDPAPLFAASAALRDAGHGARVTYSPKVFIPLTKLCRDVCHYCTFAHPPRPGERAYLSNDEVLAIARAGAAAGCREALFTLGDKPELRYRVAREELERAGFATTLELLRHMAALVLRETGLLPHLNPGLMTAEDFAALRPVSVSMGLMLETGAARLSERGGPHFGSPDKLPARRLATIAAAGEAKVPFTSGILIGIGETRAERIEALLGLRALHERHGHLQEVIIQNFRAKPGTRMANAPEPDLAEHLWTIAVARLVFGPDMSIQAPPNLLDGTPADFIRAGINDWGGVSPVTVDHVNPERPWPQIKALAQRSASAGKMLAPRLPIYPRYLAEPGRWLDPSLHTAVLGASDGEGLARPDGWTAGALSAPPTAMPSLVPSGSLTRLIDRAIAGEDLGEAGVATLFGARGGDFTAVTEVADRLRASVAGETISYIVTRNINYTNVCSYRCQFCAFSKGKLSENLRGRPYDLSIEEIQRRAVEARDRGAVELCLQGGIHPDYTGQTYLDIVAAIKRVTPAIHIHAFSPLEVFQGAATLGLSVEDFLIALKEAGLGSLPGTAAEILDDEVRAIICPDKVTTDEWLAVIETAHRVGLPTTSTIMYGHVETPLHWARHLLRLRRLQERTGGITEFVPLPFVPMEAPIFLKGRSRPGPTWREAVLMHAVARLALHPLVRNIQTSWVKMGPEGVKACLNAGANDLGGTLMNESITRAAGAAHGEEMPPEAMERMILGMERAPRMRTTLYKDVAPERRHAAFAAAPLTLPVNTPVRKRSGAAPPT